KRRKEAKRSAGATSGVPGDPSCARCALHKTAEHVCLMGRGPVPCDVMIVGEAPGRREDDVGKPFQGKAGQLLDRLMEEAGILRSEVYITNAVRCRPPENRTPKAREIEACSHWMRVELEAVKPKYVLLLGATAVKALLGDKLKDVRGRAVVKDGITYFATYHPAAAFYDPRNRIIYQLQADIERFASIIKGGVKKPPKFNPRLVTTIEELNECLEDIAQNKAIVLDIETGDLSPWTPGADVVCIGLGTKRNQWVVPLNHRQSPFKRRKAQEIVVSCIAQALQGKKLINHNFKFDALWLKVKFGLDFRFHFDTMIAAHLLDDNRPKGLKTLAQIYFGAPDWDISKKEKKGAAKLPKLAEYCAYDLYWTRRLWLKFKEELRKDDGLWRLFKYVLVPAANMYVDAEYRGVYIDMSMLDEVEQSLLKELDDIQKQLDKFKKGVNWNSNQQIAQYLFKEQGLTPLEYTPKGNPSTSESILKRLASKHKA